VIIIAGTITIAPDRRAACIAATEPYQRSTREDEAGCAAYVFSPDPLHTDRIAVFERWMDAEALDAHFLHPNFHAMRALLGEHGITGAEVRKYRVDAEAPVNNAERVPTASFDV
jgi:quinol monooxygenase YgiN